jgi:hypothetical protein
MSAPVERRDQWATAADPTQPASALDRAESTHPRTHRPTWPTTSASSTRGTLGHDTGTPWRPATRILRSVALSAPEVNSGMNSGIFTMSGGSCSPILKV